MESSSPEGFKKALAVFEEHAPAILEIDLTIKGKPMMADLLNLLSLGDAYDNPNALNMMADKLPAMLVFYGLELIMIEEKQASLEEEIELFIQEHWQETLETLTKTIDALKDAEGKKIPSGLKSAPTKDGIRAAIINGNKATWNELKSRLVTTTRLAKVLSNIYKGIEQRSRLLNSQLQVSNSMVLRGINKT
jgi:hypothetical protein